MGMSIHGAVKLLFSSRDSCVRCCTLSDGKQAWSLLRLVDYSIRAPALLLLLAAVSRPRARCIRCTSYGWLRKPKRNSTIYARSSRSFPKPSGVVLQQLLMFFCCPVLLSLFVSVCGVRSGLFHHCQTDQTDILVRITRENNTADENLQNDLSFPLRCTLLQPTNDLQTNCTRQLWFHDFDKKQFCCRCGAVIMMTGRSLSLSAVRKVHRSISLNTPLNTSSTPSQL